MNPTADISNRHAAEPDQGQPSQSADKRGHKGPERRCIVSRESAHKSELLKFVCSPDGVVTPDIMEKLPGRSAYINADAETLAAAVKTNAFTRAFKGKAKVPDGLDVLVTDLLSRRVLGLIAMGMKSGRLRYGYDPVKSLAQSGELAIRIEARDGAADGRGKLRVIAKAVGRAEHGAVPPLIGCFTALELGQAIGRPPIVHAAIERGRLAKTLKLDMWRLAGFRGLVPQEWEDRQHEL